MPEIPRSQLAVYVAAALALALIGARYLRESASQAGAGPPAAAPVRVEAPGAGGRATVHVAGEVRRPGVYRLPARARVAQAVERAGGATSRGDLGAVNLAARVDDGRQVIVPARRAAGGSPAVAGAVGGAGGAARPPLPLNTATIEELQTLDGVGPATAQKIVAHREEHGGFASVEELTQVPGIGEKRLASLREQVTL
jgi:competence protein ComEA